MSKANLRAKKATSSISRKARTKVNITSDEPNFDSLMLSIKRREDRRSRRRRVSNSTDSQID